MESDNKVYFKEGMKAKQFFEHQVDSAMVFEHPLEIKRPDIE